MLLLITLFQLKQSECRYPATTEGQSDDEPTSAADTPTFPPAPDLVLVNGVPKMREFRQALKKAGIPFLDERGHRMDYHALRTIKRLCLEKTSDPTQGSGSRHCQFSGGPAMNLNPADLLYPLFHSTRPQKFGWQALEKHPIASGWGDDLDVRKICAITSGVPRDERPLLNFSVSTDIEIRQWRPADPASLPVQAECLCTQTSALPW